MSREFECCGRCACCNPKVFAQWFGDQPHRRRTHEEVVIEKRKKALAIAYRKELYAKLRVEREARKMRRKIK